MEVRLEDLSKIFVGRKGEEVAAVDHMSFTIPDGKLVGLLGPSGCGKSTTLYMIAGLHKPTNGRIWFGDADVTNVPPENRGIGLVFQNYALYPHMTVRQNIMFPLLNVRPKLEKAEMENIAQEMANLVDIGRLLDRKPKELSGGQQQRVAIARALSKRPQVLLLDEPLSNLDARLRLQTREEIKRIQRETGITTIFVTHDQEEAMSISDEIVVMRKGVVQQIDEPQKVYDEPKNLFVAKFLGSPAINILDGEMIDGKVYVNGELFEKGFKSKGEFNFNDEGIFHIAVEQGYLGTLDQYNQAIQAIEGLDIKKIYGVVSANGYKKDLEDFDEAVGALRAAQKVNRPVKVAVRPEAFSLTKTESGIIHIDVLFIEHIGRDISVVGTVSGMKTKVRIIIPSEYRQEVKDSKISFFAKRFFIFETSGERIK